jgi:hypothetical protein
LVDATADAAVSVTATPPFGLHLACFDFAVKITNNGPGVVRKFTSTRTSSDSLDPNPLTIQ